MARNDGREWNQPRELTLVPDFTIHADGSILIKTGNTHVLCTAFIEEAVPSFLRGQGKGWVTAEYSMLPGSSSNRIRRERSKVGGRTQEIQRLIGRSLRSVINFEALGERTVWIDCDVLQADGGTRTASITGGYIAMMMALKKLNRSGDVFETFPVEKQVAAISLGIVKGTPLLDLDYSEDSTADVDMNVIMTSDQQLVEIQGTAEHHTFSRKELNQMLDLAEEGLQIHFAKQLECLEI